MNRHIGTKLIDATFMTRAAYNEYRGWTLPANENGDDAGFLVEYVDGGAGNDSRHVGYISWSPAEVFARAYRPTTGMSFGLAIEALKTGGRVARAGWNGKGMWIILVSGTPGVQMRDGTPYHAAGIEVSDILPHIDMWTVNADGRRAMLPGWVASQTDMLADDWQLVI